MIFGVGTAVRYLFFCFMILIRCGGKAGSCIGAFALSCAGLLLLTAAACWKAKTGIPPVWSRAGFSPCVFCCCFATLFSFALPFEETYVRESRGRRVCRTGMYALCRHPGVLWYAGFYFSLYAALGGAPLLVLAVTGTVLDLLYAVFQDVWTFPKTLLRL